jgi:hypothetical protein
MGPEEEEEMNMASSSSQQQWQEKVLELTKLLQEQGDPPFLWAVEVGKCLLGAGLQAPSVELGQLLISHLCWSNNGPMLWKYIEQAMGTRLLNSLHILALLTSRVIPYRQLQPEAYRLYLELLNRYAFSPALLDVASCQEKTVKAVDEALQLSQVFGTPLTELGQTVVLFLFTAISYLLDATAEDWGLQVGWSEKQWILTGSTGQHDMEIDVENTINEKRQRHRENLRRTNSLMAMEAIGKLMEHKRTSSLLRLVRRNMPEQWTGLFQRLQIYESRSSLSNSKMATELFTQLTGCIQRGLSQEFRPSQHHTIKALMDAGSNISLFEHNHGVGRAASWLPFDLFMEDAMEGKQLLTISAIEMLAELVKSLQAVNGASWQETFLGLWIASLRLIQRERDPLEGPIPHLDARLSILLSITPLAVMKIIEEEERTLQTAGNNAAGDFVTTNDYDKERKGLGTKRAALVSSLNILGQFESLLAPPQSVVSAANQAAAKAANVVSSLNGGNVRFDGLSSNDSSSRTGGNMWHLIIEACIARRLIDSTAYFWPGYVGELVNPLPQSTPVQVSPWAAFMEGAAFSVSLRNALIATPASSLAELEKVYQIAINGPEEERTAAARILCGASLICGWNVQEHAVCLVLKLLSPPAPPDYRGSVSHLVANAPLLYAVLLGVTSADIVHVLSLYGMFPEVAVALMPICEVFGSISPTVPQTSNTGEDISVYMVFSCAFLLLLKLWKFYRPPFEHCFLGKGAPVGSELTLEYLLLLRNNHLASSFNTSVENSTKENEQYLGERSSVTGSRLPQPLIPVKGQSPGALSSITQPVLIDSFPKFNVWYHQHKACIASTLSGIVRCNPLHQIADRLLNMMYRKLSKGGTVSSTPGASASSSLSNSSGSVGEEASLRPLLPAWDILGAVPFVVDAVLTACAHGRLSPRDLTTGLRDLVDFLPASLATIVSYFTAEVTRGVWKPASMNGTDWPSPAANFHNIEAQIKEVLAATGVHIPSLTGGNAPATLPLPLAALVSLTITFKLDKSSEFLHGVAGPALESTAGGSPWPSTPIVAALWAQKVRRWHDYIVFFSSRTVFKQDKHAVVQLLKSCFAAALGSSNSLMSKLTVHGGVGALLGHGFRSHLAPGGMSPVAPGFLYLRTYRAIYDIMFIPEEILCLVVGAARDLSTMEMDEHSGQTGKPAHRLKSRQLSLATVMAKVKQASTLGASLLCVTGGSGLVQMLYQETLPTWFLSGSGTKPKSKRSASILEGYAIAHFSILCGACAWGMNTSPLSKKRAQMINYHMEFLASALQQKFSLGCEHATWKAYVIGFLSMMITCAPNWICDVNLETLRKLAIGLRWWHEPELALALLERGGCRAMSAAAELVMS